MLLKNWPRSSSENRDTISDVYNSYHPTLPETCQRQVFLKKLEVKGDSFSFTLPSRVFRLHPAPNPRVIYASDARTQGKVTGMWLLLPSSTDELITTAIWQVSVPDEAPFDVQHVIQWILPSPLASLMSDDTVMAIRSRNAGTECR